MSATNQISNNSADDGSEPHEQERNPTQHTVLQHDMTPWWEKSCVSYSLPTYM